MVPFREDWRMFGSVHWWYCWLWLLPLLNSTLSLGPVEHEAVAVVERVVLADDVDAVVADLVDAHPTVGLHHFVTMSLSSLVRQGLEVF